MTVLLAGSADGGDEPIGGAPSSPARAVDYTVQVKPILTKHCVTCHGEAKPRGGLRLDTAKSAMRGGKGGPAIVAGKADESELIASLSGEGSTERMPLNRPPLSEAEIKILKAWIDQGAQAPANEIPGKPEKTIHWAFVPPVRSPVPSVSRPESARNEIDRFILARLDREKLAPSPEADRATLLRRLSFDLIGLPPSQRELAEFVADSRPDAYERAVERLLDSPHFGERWARPWLDEARYADSNGFNIDAPRSIWKYRDWLISALNRDYPFDQFVIDQIAGDLRTGSTPDQIIATGFHRNTPINQEGGIDVEQFRIESIVDRVATTGTVFLGLSIGCAQCHDHKYDPISQNEYYRLFAFLNNVDEPDYEIGTPERFANRERVRGEIADLHRELEAKFPDLDAREKAWEGALKLEFTQAQAADVRATFDTPREKRTPVQRKLMIELMLGLEPAFKSFGDRLKSLNAKEPKFVTTMIVRERVKDPRVSYIHLGGDFTRKGATVTPGVPAVLPAISRSEGEDHPPNRLDLAEWLADRRNPLTARVIVNRLWQMYFGRGIVETDNDFGTQGTPPSHPELLDWLACELMDRGWSLKSIHRLIVTSATYRQSSFARPDGQAVDARNRLLWRQSRLRLDAELIRDSALAVSGLLTRVVGGPSVFPPQPDGVMTLGQMKRSWVADTGPNRYRRGLYTYFWRATPHPFLTVFDAPNGTQSCTRRLRSNTPLQALTLLNDQSSIEISEALAGRILRE
ncbi:MAG: hypothetical protein ABS79_05745, partial [Planctomycetes bacterium SCN 63-9]